MTSRRGERAQRAATVSGAGERLAGKQWPRARVKVAAGVLLALLATGAQVESQCAPADNARRNFDPEQPAIAAFIDAEVARDGFARDELRTLLASARPRPELTVAMTHPIEKTLPWWQYRARFVTPGRIAGGVNFWMAHRTLLDRVALEGGVPPEYLVAILGMETNYGEATGSYRELDTLMTLAFDYPPRAAQYRSELRAFLLLSRDAGLDPRTTRGSYAGALGAPQFLPSSYRRYAVNASKAERLDLWTDWTNIFASMAKFLTAHGWQQGGPVLAEVHAAPDARPAVSGHLVLNDTVAGLEAKGLHVTGSLPAASAVVLVAAELEGAMSYRAGFKNLRVLASYNPSINYVLAVADLASELRQQIERPSNDVSTPVRP
jgi:membrane-bound lytic murein transglycosylase B